MNDAEQLAERRWTDDAARTRRLLQAAGVGLWDWELDNNRVYFSPEWKRQIGYESDEIADVFETWTERLHPDDREQALAAAQAFRDGTLSQYDQAFRLRHRDGSYRWILAQAEIERDERGVIVRMMGSHVDITLRKNAELALRASEHELRAIADALPGPTSHVGRDLRYKFVNARYLDAFGVTPENAVGRTMREVLGEEFFTHVEPYVNRVLSGERVSFDVDVPSPAGVQHAVTTFIPDCDETRNVVGFFVVGMNVTDRARAEAAVRDSEARLHHALDATLDGLWDWSVLTGDVYFSPQWERLLGYEPGEIPHRVEFFFQVAHPDDVARIQEQIDEHFAGRTATKQDEVRLKTKSGAYRWFLDRGKVVERDASGQPVRMVGTITDITERKEREVERERLELQLRQAAKMESVGRLAGGVAHDFNNMLGVILGHAELALDSVSPIHPVFSDLQGIREAATRSANITRQLLAFARQQSVNPEVLSLNDRVASMLTLLPRLIGEDITVHSVAEQTLWPINVDASQIDQILTNLCVNARKAIRGIGSIHIETANCSIDAAFCVDRLHALPGDYVRLRVRDTGVGMDANTMAHIFEPFFTTANAGDGVGLGLSTVFGAVVQNRGFIDVVSAPNAGATFDVYLPRYAGQETPSSSADVAPGRAPRAGTVLIVEDERALLVIAHKMLASEGFHVLTANSPDDAIALASAQSEPIDLLLTDVIMPGMNGRDLANILRSHRPGLRCLFMSGYPADVIATHGVLDPGVSFIQKPFRIAQLSAKVREVLEL